MKRALVLGGGGFIGNHLVKRLKNKGYTVAAVDLKYPEFDTTSADEFIIADLRRQDVVKEIFTKDFDEVYQLAADMGGAGFIFTGENDADKHQCCRDLETLEDETVLFFFGLYISRRKSN
jgi:GDP-D-mannose 3',5'-epimerase